MDGVGGIIVNMLFGTAIVGVAIYGIIDTRRKMQEEASKEKKPHYSNMKASALSRINFPTVMSSITIKQMRESIENDIKTMRSLGYNNKHDDDLVAAKEWHTYQVTMMLKFYYMGEDIRIPDPEKYFPKQIIDMEKGSLKHEVDNIMERYINGVNTGSNESFLKKDYIWTAKDVLLIAYLLNTYQRNYI